MQELRIFCSGFRSFSPRAGSPGAEKFAVELLPRLAMRAATDLTAKTILQQTTYPGVRVITFPKYGIEALRHSGCTAWPLYRLFSALGASAAQERVS